MSTQSAKQQCRFVQKINYYAVHNVRDIINMISYKFNIIVDIENILQVFL